MVRMVGMNTTINTTTHLYWVCSDYSLDGEDIASLPRYLAKRGTKERKVSHAVIGPVIAYSEDGELFAISSASPALHGEWWS